MIKLSNILLENYEVVDLRDPTWVPVHDFDKKKLNATMLSIHGGKIYKFRWGNGNTWDWKDIVPISGLDNSMMVLTNAGNLILPDRVGGNSKWEGSRNIFTDTTKEWTKILLDTGVIQPTAKVYSGNWASLKGTFLARAKDIVARDFSKLPRKLVFYHGTSSDRLDDIKQHGLKSMPLEQRPWKSDVLKQHPEYREHAVYLTYDKSKANYYAKKAVAVARRHNKRGTQMLVLKIVVPSAAYKRLLPDDDYLMQQLMQLGVTWVESLKNFSQVAYLGIIPPEWISVEYIEKSGWVDEPSIDEVNKGNRIPIYRGVSSYNKRGNSYWTTDSEWARQFTQSGLESEVKQAFIDLKVVYRANPLPEATSEEQMNAAIKAAKMAGYKAIWLNEGINEPNSIYIYDKSALTV